METQRFSNALLTLIAAQYKSVCKLNILCGVWMSEDLQDLPSLNEFVSICRREVDAGIADAMVRDAKEIFDVCRPVGWHDSVR